MKMTVNLPSDLQAFIQAEVSEGVATDEAAFLTKAVELYREMKQRHAELRAQVQRSREQADRGEARPLDMDSIIAELATEFEATGKK